VCVVKKKYKCSEHVRNTQNFYKVGLFVDLVGAVPPSP
jgi:hypothetical protein